MDEVKEVITVDIITVIGMAGIHIADVNALLQGGVFLLLIVYNGLMISKHFKKNSQEK